MEIKLDVESDHLEGEAATRPLLGLAELIWNAVDADAKTVEIVYQQNSLGGIEGITVRDDGHGIEHVEAQAVFGKLGGSWKRNKRLSRKDGRILHGQEGKGRFKAFSLGNIISWTTTYSDGKNLKSFRIVGKRPALNRFVITDPEPTADIKLGTVVEICDIRTGVDSLDDPRRVTDELARRLAIYLRKYPMVSISVSGVKVDPKRVESHSAEYKLTDIILDDGSSAHAKLAIIEWSIPTERALYLCDASGFAKSEVLPGIQAPGWNFTAYLASNVITDLEGVMHIPRYNCG